MQNVFHSSLPSLPEHAMRILPEYVATLIAQRSEKALIELTHLVLEDLHVVALPMRTTFRGITQREVALIHGQAGWGEFSPFLEYDPEESAYWLMSALECAYTQPDISPLPQLRIRRRENVPVNATLPAVSVEKVESVLAQYGDISHIHTLKIKVAGPGTTPELDYARIARAREIVGEKTAIRIDVNGMWSLEEARMRMREYEDFHLQYIEQPVADLQEMVQLRQWREKEGLATLLGADESIRKAEDPFRVAEFGAADVAIVKMQPLGGPSRMAQIAQALSMPVVLSSALESGVGISACMNAATRLPRLDYACGLATGALMAGDVSCVQIDDFAGRITAAQEKKWANEPQAHALEKYVASGERVQFWQDRIAQALRYICGLQRTE